MCNASNDSTESKYSGTLYPITSKSELEALEKNGTWIIVDLPPHVKPIGNKWVFKVKHMVDGAIDRHKAHLIAKGYNQIKCLDF